MGGTADYMSPLKNVYMDFREKKSKEKKEIQKKCGDDNDCLEKEFIKSLKKYSKFNFPENFLEG